MSYCATEGIIESLKAPHALDNETGIRLISLFDHEEIGSQTAQVSPSVPLYSIFGSDAPCDSCMNYAPFLCTSTKHTSINSDIIAISSRVPTRICFQPCKSNLLIRLYTDVILNAT